MSAVMLWVMEAGLTQHWRIFFATYSSSSCTMKPEDCVWSINFSSSSRSAALSFCPSGELIASIRSSSDSNHTSAIPSYSGNMPLEVLCPSFKGVSRVNDWTYFLALIVAAFSWRRGHGCFANTLEIPRESYQCAGVNTSWIWSCGLPPLIDWIF